MKILVTDNAGFIGFHTAKRLLETAARTGSDYTFLRANLAGDPIPVFNHGHHTRDFTYIDDIVEGVIRASNDVAVPNSDWGSDASDPVTSNAPYRLFNIGNNDPVKRSACIEAIEEALGKPAIKELLPLQPGDVPDTYADSSELQRAVGYKPATPVRQGVASFGAWYREYYDV